MSNGRLPLLEDAATQTTTAMCTANPAEDKIISAGLHGPTHWFGHPEEILFFINRSPCTQERPFMLDIGANIGMRSIVAIRYGCNAVAFELMRDNAARLWQSVLRNGLQDRATLLNVGAAAHPDTWLALYVAGNPGASKLLRAMSAEEAVAVRDPAARAAQLQTLARMYQVPESALDYVQTVPLDDLFFPPSPAVAAAAEAALPRHPHEDRPMRPSDVAAIKIDTEGYELAVLQGMRRFLLEARVPAVFVEFSPRYSPSTSGCSTTGALRFLYEEAGYVCVTSRGQPVQLGYLLAVIDAIVADKRGIHGVKKRGALLPGLFDAEELLLERNDTAGAAARGGRPLPPFIDEDKLPPVPPPLEG